MLPVTDASIISNLADATILVVNMGKSTRRAIGRTLEILHQVRAALIGTVLNGVSEDMSDGYYRYAGYYSSGAGTAGHTNIDEPGEQDDRGQAGRRTKKAIAP